MTSPIFENNYLGLDSSDSENSSFLSQNEYQWGMGIFEPYFINNITKLLFAEINNG
jgi:hypothetical protein